MQLSNTKIGSVIQGGITESTTFTIEADGKMFRILSDTLYQNKIGSMVREVSCNAVDAHIAAGKADVPFTIHAPTAMEPWFSVIDEGIGLSHDDVVNIFTCFGKSTKSGTNTMVGAFGFGSKTPFAYTNAFTVISVKDNIKNSYSAVIGEDGLPAMNLMGTEKTEQGNGVEITVAVESYDFYEFHSEIANQLRYFKVKPKITGKNIIFPNPYENVIETIDDHTYFRHGGDVEVVQGGVAYPVDLKQLEKGIGNNESLRLFINQAVSQYHPILAFDIGMIAVTPSRESISYDMVTIKNILDRLESVRLTLVERLTKKMNEASSLWERAIILKQNRDLYSKIVAFENNPWNVAIYCNDPYVALPDKFSDNQETGKGRTRHIVTHYKSKETSGGKFRVTANEDVSRIVPNKNVVIVVDDSSGYAMSRIRRYIEETDNEVYFLNAKFQKMVQHKHVKDDGTETVYSTSEGGWINADVDPTMFAAFAQAVDGCTMIFLADLPKQERIYVIKNDDGTETVKEKYTPAKAYKFKGFSKGFGFEYFKNYEKTFVAPKKMTEKAAYVIVDNRSIKTGIDYQENQFLRLAVSTKDFDLPIYAIRAVDAAKIADNPNWVPLKDAVKTLRIELEAKYKLIHVRHALMYSGEGIKTIGNEKIMKYFISNMDKIKDNILRGAVVRHTRFQNRQKKRVNEMCQHLYANDMAKIRERQTAKDNQRNALLAKRYPLLAMLSDNYYHHPSPEGIQQLFFAVNMIHENALAS